MPSKLRFHFTTERFTAFSVYFVIFHLMSFIVVKIQDGFDFLKKLDPNIFFVVNKAQNLPLD